MSDAFLPRIAAPCCSVVTLISKTMPQVQQSIAPAIHGFDPSPIFEGMHGLQPGEGNLIIGANAREVLGRMAAGFLRFRKRDGDRYIRGVTFIVPPRAIWPYSDDETKAIFVKGVEDMNGEPLPAEVAARLGTRVHVHRCTRLDTEDVASAVAECGERQVILIPASSKYRDSQLQQSFSLGRSSSLLAEDFWVPHAARLAKVCTELAEPRGSVIVFSATEDFLVKQANIDMLNAVELLFTCMVGNDADKQLGDLLSTQVPRWVALAAAGKVQKAYHEIDGANLDASLKRQVLMQVAARAGEKERVLAIVREYLSQMSDIAADALARLGRLANTYGDKAAARQFFHAAIDSLEDQLWLEVSLLTVTSLGAADLVDRCWRRIETLFPTSAILQENRELRLLSMCDAQTSGQEPVSRAGFDDVHCHIADALLPGAHVDYDALVAYVRKCWPQHTGMAALCASLHALEHHDLPATIVHGIEAAQDARHEAQAVRVLLGALRRMFLLEMANEVGFEPFKLALAVILRFLGCHPDESSLRAGVASVLSVESAGRIGLPVLVSLTLDVLAGGVAKAQPPGLAEPSSQQHFMAFFERALVWMSQQPAVEAGAMRLPADIVGANAAGHIAALETILRHGARHHEGAEDLVFLERGALAMCLLHPYAPQYCADLGGLRLLAAKLNLHGQPQRSRDYAEQMLVLGRDSPQRQRLAWGNYADIYQRTRSPIDALIGLTCAALTQAPLEPADLFQEAYTLLRVARDLHLFDLARQALKACRQLYDLQGLGAQGEERLQGIELTLDVVQHTSLNPNQLLELLERTRLHCEQVMRGTDELHPPAAQFLQIAGAVERAGGRLPHEAIVLREKLGQILGADTAALLRTISAIAPDLKDVLWLHNRVGATTNSEDAPADQYSVVLAAARLLQQREADIASEDAAVAIELLADRGIALAGPVAPLNADWPATFIRDLSLAGLGVLLLATDNDGELVAVVAEVGKLRVVRPTRKQRSFETNLKAWANNYPYRYGSIEREDGNGEFYESMGDFELPMPNADKVVVVAQPLVQQIPFNIALVQGDFAGESKAIGIAPSLTWFNDARQRPTNTSRARHAWISCSQQAEAYGALDMIYARLGPVFEQHGFTTDTSGKMPANVRGAGIAVVTAHGQLTAEKRYIHSIADEQDLTESPVTLARVLAGAELVVLFVCSGGRVDPHPMANTTVSLPKMLLDRGCRTVIASPWPLDVSVPGNWLERFLEAWDAGDNVIEANFKANAYVRERLGPEPSLCLAMTVFGDVLLTR